MKKTKKVCAFCKIIYIDLHYRKDKKYCSNDCYIKDKHNKSRIQKKCEFCHAEFDVLKSQSFRRYCSGSCSAKDNPKIIKKSPEEIFFQNVIIPENKNLCWIYPKLIMKGYGHLYVNGKKCPAHRFSYEYHKGPINNDLLCFCHVCDVRLCCNPAHLFLGTHQDNMKDMVMKGRNSHKLSKDDVIFIKLRINNNEKDKDIAKDYAIQRDTVGKIRRGETWSHIIV